MIAWWVASLIGFGALMVGLHVGVVVGYRMYERPADARAE